MFVRNRIAWAPEDGGAGGAPADGGTTSTADQGAAPPAGSDTATGGQGDDAPVSALKDTLLSAEPPKTEGEQKPGDADKGKGAGEGEEEEPPAPEMKPEDYKLELPEGITTEDPLLAAFLEGAAKGGMSNESVQAVVSSLGPKLAEQLAAPVKAWVELNEQWQAEVKADPVIGGANLPITQQTVQDAMNLVGTPEEVEACRKALTMTGAGNNPAIIRIVHKMASRLVEKGAVQGKSPAEVRNPATLLYPTHNAAKGG